MISWGGVCGGSFLPAGEFPGMMIISDRNNLIFFFISFFVHCSTCSDTEKQVLPLMKEIQLSRWYGEYPTFQKSFIDSTRWFSRRISEAWAVGEDTKTRKKTSQKESLHHCGGKLQIVDMFVDETWLLYTLED